MTQRVRAWIIPAILLAIISAGILRSFPASANPEDEQYGILLPLMLQRYYFGPGQITGRVIDAANGRRLGGVSICLNPLECVLTNLEGEYTITAFPGDHQMSASLTGYYTIEKSVFVIGGNAVELNFALSPYITGGNIELRAVLTWDPIPVWPPDQVENDLDAHLWLDAILPVHIHYDNRGDCTTYPNACLESDSRLGSGPETVAIRQFEPETVYYFGVLNYNQGASGVPPIKNTGAHLEVYDETGLVVSYDVVSVQGGGNFWYLFTYSYSPQQGAWILTEKNCIVFYSENIQDIIAQCP